MRFLNFGSMNLDYVYQVPHFATAGETLEVAHFSVHLGGKGLNQSIALCRAGAEVYHAGCIGADGLPLQKALGTAGVNALRTEVIDIPSGRSVIQVMPDGSNSIMLYSGANRGATCATADKALNGFGVGDILLLQNETNMLAYLMDKAYDAGMKIAFNPSPVSPELDTLPMEKVTWFLLNEKEGAAITGIAEPERMLDAFLTRWPQCRVVLTLGSTGAWYKDARQTLFQPAFPVAAVDTTGAGDTFTGYFLQSVAAGVAADKALHRAAAAAALAVMKEGTSEVIPHSEAVDAFLSEQP